MRADLAWADLRVAALDVSMAEIRLQGARARSAGCFVRRLHVEKLRIRCRRATPGPNWLKFLLDRSEEP
jgi:hypothetical protein